MHQLANSEIFMRIGNASFRIPRNIFSNPGDTPNFFTLGFTAFFGSEIETTRRKAFIRPPPLAPPTVPNRSGELFSELFAVLQGSPVNVRDDEHRRMLVRECRYYRFRNLEQRLIEHQILINRARQSEEIVINLEDIKDQHLAVTDNKDSLATALFYKRPFVDTISRELILQVKGNEPIVLMKPAEAGSSWEVIFFDSAKEKFKSVQSALRDKFTVRFSTGQKGYLVNVDDASISVNGSYIDPRVDTLGTSPESYGGSSNSIQEEAESSGLRKRPRTVPAGPIQLIVNKSQWRIKLFGDGMAMFELLTAECTSGQRYKNKMRKFL
ncbi:hypothetical protein D0Z00_001485 [Geotrichum galactomycetum]|uniref:Uncharacterized protein n=1 Tax=Geotrichum galactomycetum TaxID=27317 RepID=A0ACB6V6Z2_9ASCO|nr:hypothetical protein D0Z00_001485 [Geotrichum candidum]